LARDERYKDRRWRIQSQWQVESGELQNIKITMAAGLAVEVVRLFLLTTLCKFFFVDPASRNVLTNQTSKLDKIPHCGESIITRSSLLGFEETADLKTVSNLVNECHPVISKSPFLPKRLHTRNLTTLLTTRLSPHSSAYVDFSAEMKSVPKIVSQLLEANKKLQVQLIKVMAESDCASVDRHFKIRKLNFRRVSLLVKPVQARDN
jgi:hypothetical protein